MSNYANWLVVLSKRTPHSCCAACSIINERTVRAPGRLPHGGLPVQVKRKSKRAPWEQPVQDLPKLDTDAPLVP
ncbi:hypothetical protein GGR62_003593 [Xanthomonas campestris]|nr:hypothetical protein [Xanthomonas sp. 3075]